MRKDLAKYLLLFSLLYFAGCYSSGTINNQNYSGDYDKRVNNLHPELMANHLNKQKTRVYIKINASELLYAKPPEGNMRSRFKIIYRLFNSMESKVVLDSATLTFVDEKNNQTSNDIINSFDINTSMDDNFVLQVRFIDQNKNDEAGATLHITRTNVNNRHNFILFSNETYLPLFRNNLLPEENVSISHNDVNVTKLFVRYYNRDFPVSVPPFSNVNPISFKYAADSVFVINISGSSNFKGDFKAQGFYHIQADTTNKDGLTIYRYYDNFPKVNKPDLMIPPLRYITSKHEYDDIMKAENRKKALDNFWLELTGNNERAKELIRIFYNRVQDANKYFSSYQEGWRTDRGMIYLVYGPPNNIYKSDNAESWTYGEENNMRSIQFTFVKVNNPFTDNDYTLNRNQMYKDSWYLAVDTWRQGRVFNN